MPQEPKKPQPQRPLTSEELARFAESKFTASQLQLIWSRKMPVNASLEDFEMFLYVCAAKSLDPLLGEVYARLQWDREATQYRLIIIDSIHGMLKLADATGQFNGIKTTFNEVDGVTVSATTLVWRKGCEHPFEATAYWDEFVGLHEGKPNFFWSSKPHLMLGKCSQALALRLAFAAALAGVYVTEELDHSESVQEPDIDFAVGRLGPDVVSDSQTESIIQESNNPSSQIAPDAGTSILPQKEPNDAPSMPLSLSEIRAKNQALVQRLMLDLNVDKSIKVTVLTDYYKGYLGTDILPKDPAVFTPALEALDQFATANRDAHDQFIRGPLAVGKRLREESEKGLNATT